MKNPAHHDPFLALARWASMLACGVLGGFLYSLKRVNPTLEVKLGLGSVLAAVLGAWLCGFLWNLATQQNPEGSDSAVQTRRRKNLILTALALSAVVVAAYIYALKDVRGTALLEVVQGVTLAVLVVGGIGIVLVKLVRALEKDQPPDGSTGTEDDSSSNPSQE